MTTRAAIYARISYDPNGTALGVERQQQECEALAARRGMLVVRTFVDNDISAYSGKVRPQYQLLLGLIAADALDVVVAWAPDRLHRSPRELEDWLDLAERHNVGVETVQSGAWDLSTPSGRMVARQLGAVARYESELKAARVRAAAAQRAQRGIRASKTAYGWKREVDTSHPRGFVEVIDEKQAAVVQRIAAEILAGHSLKQIVRKLVADEVPTPTGLAPDRWRPQVARRLVLRESNAARRMHLDEVVGEADWPAIISGDVYDRVRALLSDPTRRKAASTAAVHLLSGLAKCGLCGAAVRVASARGQLIYRCSAKTCVTRDRDRVDDLVTRVILARLAAPDARGLLARHGDGHAEAEEAEQEAAALQARLDLAADQFADGEIDGRAHLRIAERLRPRIEAARARAAAYTERPAYAELIDTEDAAARWADMSLSQRRAVIVALVDVTIEKTALRGRLFSPESVRIDWRV